MEIEQPSPYNNSFVLQHVNDPSDIMYCRCIANIVHYSRNPNCKQYVDSVT